MQISTLVRRFILIFLRYLFPRELSFAFRNIEPSTVTRTAFDNDECHVRAFRPISEAAHSWSYDKSDYIYTSRLADFINIGDVNVDS